MIENDISSNNICMHYTFFLKKAVSFFFKDMSFTISLAFIRDDYNLVLP